MRNLYLILVLATNLLPFAAQAAPANLPETGQTTCYDVVTHLATSCLGTTGQDGNAKDGVAWPTPRFVIGTGDGVGCVSDNLTGLMWVRAPNSVPVSWTTALTTANDLNLCGFTDWRLPNINELESLVNSEVADQAIFLNNRGFTGVQASAYWSSSSSAVNSGNAWIVTMNYGHTEAYSKSTNWYVWPVRAGQ